MRTAPLFLDLLATIAAKIVAFGVGEVSPKGKGDVCHHQEIAHIIDGGDGEDDVANGTDACQSQEIEHPLAKRQVMEDIIDGRHAHKKNRPHRHEEKPQQPLMRERIERGIEIEVLPSVGGEHLHAGI